MVELCSPSLLPFWSSFFFLLKLIPTFVLCGIHWSCTYLNSFENTFFSKRIQEMVMLSLSTSSQQGNAHSVPTTCHFKNFSLWPFLSWPGTSFCITKKFQRIPPALKEICHKHNHMFSGHMLLFDCCRDYMEALKEIG